MNKKTEEMTNRLHKNLVRIADKGHQRTTTLTDIAILTTQNGFVLMEILKQLTDIREQAEQIPEGNTKDTTP